MAPRQLNFAVGPLIGMAAICAGAAVAMGAIALDIGQGGRLRGLLRLFGTAGAYWLCLALALLCVAAALGLTRRLVGDRTAAAIRHDGVWTAGIFLSRFVRWRDIERLSLRTWQGPNGRTNYFLRVVARRRAGESWLHHRLAETGQGTPAHLIAGGAEQIAAWLDRAEAERIEALQPRTVRPARTPAEARPPAPLIRGFGRKVG